MKITYETTVTLNQEQLFVIMKEAIEKKTGKRLANFSWQEDDAGMTCKIEFCNETVELDDERSN